MSTQDAPIIHLTHAPNNTGYRLLELPAELAALLEGPSPPVLYLENGPTGTATLRSPDHTYALRQRNTSNSIILVSPTDPTSVPLPKDVDGNDDDQRPVQAGLTAFATIHESMELIRQAPEKSGGAGKPHTGSMGKWHERFGKGR